LETTYEGTKLVKSAKLQMLILKFEEIKMLDDETFNEFYIRINNLRNSMLSLGKKVSDLKLIRKILRSLPKRFGIKVTTIEESKDLDSMKIEELVWSLQTYEHFLPPVKKAKVIGKTIKDKSRVSPLMKTQTMKKKMQLPCSPKMSVDWWRMINLRRSSLKDWGKLPDKPRQKKMRRRILEVLDTLSAHALGTWGLIAGISSRPRGKAYNVNLSKSKEDETSDKDQKFLAFVAPHEESAGP